MSVRNEYKRLILDLYEDGSTSHGNWKFETVSYGFNPIKCVNLEFFIRIKKICIKAFFFSSQK